MEQDKIFTYSETHSFKNNIPRGKKLNKQKKSHFSCNAHGAQ